MKILLTGANGYIGTRLLPLLIEDGHEIYAFIRSRFRFKIPEKFKSQLHIIEGDLLNPASLDKIPIDIDAAYYLVHSMTYSQNFAELEAVSAQNFKQRMDQTQAKQIIFLSGIANEALLSAHLNSRKRVGEILKEGKIPVTILMTGIIIGSGSASFEIIRDLVEKLPIMIAPKWINNLVQPIALTDVLDFLRQVLNNPACINQSFEVGGPQVLSYKQLLLKFAKIRGLKRWIITVPVLTPRLSSLWLFFVTSISFNLSRALVDSLMNNAICKENRIQTVFPKKLLSFEEAVRLAFTKTEFGAFTDKQIVPFTSSIEKVRLRIWSLGGDRGWPAMNWAWAFRGFLDQLFGGVGLRRGRTHPNNLEIGDALDFWRVLLADEQNRRLLLYSEMKLPGEGWLEFEVIPNDTGGGTLYQTATFRPRGLLGRLYWYACYPFHMIIFKRLAKELAK